MSTKSTHQPQPTPVSSPTNHPTFISAYSVKNRSQILFPAEGRTKQSFKDECDINNIMRRFEQTGTLSHLNNRTPVFGDMEEIDFQGSLNIVVEAQARFALLPATVRDRFANDPSRLLAFVQDEGNREEAIKLGLVRSAEPPPQSTPPASIPDQSPT